MKKTNATALATVLTLTVTGSAFAAEKVYPFQSCQASNGNFCRSEVISVNSKSVPRKRVMLRGDQAFTNRDGFCYLVGVQGDFEGMVDSVGTFSTAEFDNVRTGEWYVGAWSHSGHELVANAQCIWFR